MAATDPYRRIAGTYDRIVEPMQAGVRKLALDVVPPEIGWTVLDVGCGTGTGLAGYLGAGCVVTGVDTSPAMLEQARHRFSDAADLRLTEGDSLSFDDGGFDLTTTSMVLHEVPDDERSGFVTEMARVTKPDGKLMLIDFRFGTLRGWRGRTNRSVSAVIERLSGHYSGYRSFKASGGVPSIVAGAGLEVQREKVVAGGNLGIFVVTPASRKSG